MFILTWLICVIQNSCRVALIDVFMKDSSAFGNSISEITILFSFDPAGLQRVENSPIDLAAVIRIAANNVPTLNYFILDFVASEIMDSRGSRK